MICTEQRVVEAIRTITADTGFPPDAEELAYALTATTRQVHSALLGPKMRGEVRYDDGERFVLRDGDAAAPEEAEA